MHLFIFAAEAAEVAASSPPGDEFLTGSLILTGIALFITAIATWRVTPGAEHH